MALKQTKKPIKKNNKPAAAPVKKSKEAPRELTRAEKTAQAREAAAKRNAEMLTPKRAVTPAPASEKKPVKGTGKAARPSARRTLSARPVNKKEQQASSRREINRKINTQTRAHRSAERTGKKVSGSIKNLEIKRREKASNHSFRVKKKDILARKILISRLVMFLLAFSVLFALTAGVFTLSLKLGRSNATKAYILQLGADIPEGMESQVKDEDKPVQLEIPKECSVRYGKLYIPISALTDMCEFTVTGTQKDLRYLPRESSGQSMRFEVGTDIAYVNGEKVRMISPSFIHEGKLYIPLDFMQKYSEGLTIETDEVNCKITISKYREGYDAATDSDIYSRLSFKLFDTQPLSPVEEPKEE